jgi:hypothetical protein
MPSLLTFLALRYSANTTYGDVSTCVFPDGSSVDLRGLYNSALGGYWPGYDYNYLGSYVRGISRR